MTMMEVEQAKEPDKKLEKLLDELETTAYFIGGRIADIGMQYATDKESMELASARADIHAHFEREKK